MKKIYTSMIALALGAVSSLPLAAQETLEYNPVADTWIRETSTTFKGGSSNKIEIQRTEITNDAKEVIGYGSYVGLIGFNYSVPTGMRIESATLILTTERYKGRDVVLRPYENDFDEGSATWGTESEYVENAFAGESITSFTPAGQKGKAITDNGLNATYQDPNNWVNTIDITDYMKTLPTSTPRVNFMLSQEGDSKGDQDCFYTKEAQDLTNGNYNFTVSADDLKPVLKLTFVEDKDASTSVILPSGDSFVRSDGSNATKNYGSNDNLELYWNALAATTTAEGSNVADTRDRQLYGFMSFKLPAEVTSGQQIITDAKLRLTHTMVKGDRNMDIYVYVPFDENTATWNSEKDNINTAFEKDPIASYSANGQGSKAMWDGGINDNYKNAEAWTNTIDLTDYLKDYPADLNLMFARKNASNGNAIRIASKEAQDIENTKDESNPFTFAAEDLKPQLTITYKKKDGTTAIVDIEVEENVDGVEAPVEYYNVQGIRVENPEHGLYIKRQGNKVSKVIL